MRGARESSVGLALVILEGIEEEAHLPDKVKPLVEEFSNVLTDSLPVGLSQLRDIQRTIDLIQISVLSNRPAYRMRPTEFQEL